MTDADRNEALQAIRSHIATHGQHLYLVQGGEVPRYAYTIGLLNSVGFELVLAGATTFDAEEVAQVLNGVAAACKREGADLAQPLVLDGLASLGAFTLQEAHPTWVAELMLGAIDHHGRADVRTLQVVPDAEHWTLDIPDLSEPWDADAEPAWAGLRQPWTQPFPPDAVATTNLDALRGERVTEAARWESDQWELFAGPGPDVTPDQVRMVPLATLLAIDSTLAPVVQLDVGRALWRDDQGGDWQAWG
nr:DUF4262 domain-containing protein [uncultured Aquabacterium sp.]